MIEPGGDGSSEGVRRPDYIPSVRDITFAYREVRNHNKAHTGIRAALANKLDAFNAEEADGTPKNDTLDQKDFARDANAGFIDITTTDLFTRIGIKIARFGTQTEIEEIARQHESTSKAQLVPIVDNVELFKEFLSTLTPDDARDKGDNYEDVPVLLEDVVNTLKRTLVLGYQPPQDATLYNDDRQLLKDTGDEALRIFTEIDPIYKDSLHVRDEPKDQALLDAEKSRIPPESTRRRIDFISNYRILEKAEKYWGMNVLPEYIEGLPYITPADVRDPGPATWHKHATFQRAPHWERVQWREALGFLKRMDSDERTRAFGHDVRDSLIAGLAVAIDETDRVYVYKRHKEDFVNIRNFLTGEEYDQAKLDKYINPPDASL